MQTDWCKNNYLVTFLTTKSPFSVTHMGETLMDYRDKLVLVLFLHFCFKCNGFPSAVLIIEMG